jgi:hypothetical protein
MNTNGHEWGRGASAPCRGMAALNEPGYSQHSRSFASIRGWFLPLRVPVPRCSPRGRCRRTAALGAEGNRE